MPRRPQTRHVERTGAFLGRVREWVQAQEDVRALTLVGSVARGDARPDSDVDLVLLVTDKARYLESLKWLSDLGTVESIKLENYGKVTSVRATYGDGLEVEFGVAPADWASIPLDSGTEEVARHGLVVVLDRDGDVTELANALSPSDAAL